MAPTKAGAVSTGWTAQAAAGGAVSAAIDASAMYNAGVCVESFLDANTATALGVGFVVEVSPLTTGDDEWVDLAQWTGLITAAALTCHMEDDPLAAGSATIAINPTAAFTQGAWFGIKDGVDVLNSELCRLKLLTTNTSFTLYGITAHAHLKDTVMWSVAEKKVICLPDWVQRVRLVIINTQTVAGASMVWKLSVGDITAL